MRELKLRTLEDILFIREAVKIASPPDILDLWMLTPIFQVKP